MAVVTGMNAIGQIRRFQQTTALYERESIVAAGDRLERDVLHRGTEVTERRAETVRPGLGVRTQHWARHHDRRLRMTLPHDLEERACVLAEQRCRERDARPAIRAV